MKVLAEIKNIINIFKIDKSVNRTLMSYKFTSAMTLGGSLERIIRRSEISLIASWITNRTNWEPTFSLTEKPLKHTFDLFVLNNCRRISLTKVPRLVRKYGKRERRKKEDKVRASVQICLFMGSASPLVSFASLIMEREQTDYFIFVRFKQRRKTMVGESEINDR